MQFTPNSPNKKEKYFLKTTQPNNLLETERMPPRKQRIKTREPKLHKFADKLTEILIYFMAIFSLWAFGTTESWSIWTMNITAYTLGCLLITKWTVRWTAKYIPNPAPSKEGLSLKQNRLRLIQKACTIMLAGSMFLLLSYTLISAINARGSFNLDNKLYTYFDEVNRNLPHSYNAKATWLLFWQNLGLVILFWSTRDWFAGAKLSKSTISINPRIKRLLLLLCFNGGALALESIFQRIYFGEHSGKLLFLIEPTLNSSNMAHFGPFAYRSNASSYLNLIWPICLGLFIQLARENLEYSKKRIGSGVELLLIPCIVLAASSPIISSARGGTLVMVFLLIIVSISFIFINIRSRFLRFSISSVLFIGLGTAYYLGWEKIEIRLVNSFLGDTGGRPQIFETTLGMIDEYVFTNPLAIAYGSGPGTFQAIAQFEINQNFDEWHSWVHNDYLETLLTFGVPGSFIIIVVILNLLILLITNCFAHKLQILFLFFVFSFLGVIVHAAYDFPIQVYSICLLLILILASTSLREHSYSRQSSITLKKML